MKTKILILLLTSYLFLGCNEDDNPFTLPDATQKGANTAGCYIDGDLYVLKNAHTQDAWIGSSKTLDLKYSYDEKVKLWQIIIYIKLYNNKEKSESINFILTSKEKMMKGKYQLFKYEENSNFALLDKARTYDNLGVLDIKFIESNKENLLISGLFNFNAKKENSNEIIKVTNGRFDLKKNKN